MYSTLCLAFERGTLKLKSRKLHRLSWQEPSVKLLIQGALTRIAPVRKRKDRYQERGVSHGEGQVTECIPTVLMNNFLQSAQTRTNTLRWDLVLPRKESTGMPRSN